jgi:hypothetical protein
MDMILSTSYETATPRSGVAEVKASGAAIKISGTATFFGRLDSFLLLHGVVVRNDVGHMKR